MADPRTGLLFVLLPAGDYPKLGALSKTLGTPDSNEADAARVGPLWMMATDVTAAAYVVCIKANAYSPSPGTRDEVVPRCALKNELLHHPMNCVNWAEAGAFCTWLGGRLPTSQEWEYAAASGKPGKTFPWGEANVDAKHANYCDVNCPKALGTDGKNLELWEQRGWIDRNQDDGWAATSPVGIYTAGSTDWGLLDMAGNVWQWTSTLVGEGKREVRGGSWDNAPASLRIHTRLAWLEDRADAGMGFRCVKDQPTSGQPDTPR